MTATAMHVRTVIRAVAVASAALALTLVAEAKAEKSQDAAATAEQGAPASAAAPPRAEPELEPKAIELLKAACSRLAAAHTLSFTAVGTYESPSLNGVPLAYTTISEVTLQRPNKLRVIVPGDGPASEFYYDGKTMMAYAPAEGLVAIADAPPTIDEMLQRADAVAAIYFPFTDVIVSDPYKDLAESLVLAYYIGQSRVVGGTTTDMIAVASDSVFGQIWIGAEDHLPRRIRAIYANDPQRLRQQVELSDWHLDGEIPADAFTSSRAKKAKRIEFARPDPQPPAGTVRSEPAAQEKTK